MSKKRGQPLKPLQLLRIRMLLIANKEYSCPNCISSESYYEGGNHEYHSCRLWGQKTKIIKDGPLKGEKDTGSRASAPCTISDWNICPLNHRVVWKSIVGKKKEAEIKSATGELRTW